MEMTSGRLKDVPGTHCNVTFVISQTAVVIRVVTLSSARDWYLSLSAAQTQSSTSAKPSPLQYKYSRARGGSPTPGKTCSRAGK